MKGRWLTLGIVMAMLAFPVAAQAAGGDLDPTFDGDGRVSTGFAGDAHAAGVVVQADGKIVTAGEVTDPVTGDARFALARYRPNGTLDPTFSGDGKVTTAFPGVSAQAFAVTLQRDGKIVAAGSGGPGFALARYRTDGSLDPTFGGDGRVSTSLASGGFAKAVVVQADGRIMAAGQRNAGSGDFLFALARYRANGSLDRTFGGDGRVSTAFPGGLASAQDVAVRRSGQIVVAGSASNPATFRPRFALARYRSDGTLDPTFGGDGKVNTVFPGGFSEAFGVALAPNGVIVAAGDTRPGPSDFMVALARYRPDGSLDPTFGGDGRVSTGFGPGSSSGASDVRIGAGGEIVTAGSSLPTVTESGFALTRYRPNGKLDPTFGGDGRVTTFFPGGFARGSALAFQSDGKIIAVGDVRLGSADFAFALARYSG